jgi:hypothetical protein
MLCNHNNNKKTVQSVIVRINSKLNKKQYYYSGQR